MSIDISFFYSKNFHLFLSSCQIHHNLLLQHILDICDLYAHFIDNVFKRAYFIAYCSSKASSRPDCIFEIHQLW